MTRTWSRVAVAVVLVCTVLAAAAVVQTSAAAPDQSGSQVSATTTYDGETATQRISVTLTLEPVDEPMSDVRVRVASAADTLLVDESFTTTITPSNQGVNVTPMGDGVFVVEELQPGETVALEFAVVPTTLGVDGLTAARLSVEYTQDGRALSMSLAPTADLSANPWRRANASSSGPSLPTMAGGAVVVGIAGLLLGVAAARTRTDSTVEWADVEPAFDRAQRRVEDTVAQAELDRLASTVRDHCDTDGDDDSPTVFDRLRSLVTRQPDSGSGEAVDDGDYPKL